MIFTLLLVIFLCFEIQKLFQHNFFFRLNCLAMDYKKEIIKKPSSIAYLELMKVSLLDFFYLTIILIGVFTVNCDLFLILILLTSLQFYSFRITKNKLIRKTIYFIDTIFSIILLLAIIINLSFYHLDGFKFIQQLLNF